MAIRPALGHACDIGVEDHEGGLACVQQHRNRVTDATVSRNQHLRAGSDGQLLHRR
jgi:hypothetical protein